MCLGRCTSVTRSFEQLFPVRKLFRVELIKHSSRFGILCTSCPVYTECTNRSGIDIDGSFCTCHGRHTAAVVELELVDVGGVGPARRHRPGDLSVVSEADVGRAGKRHAAADQLAVARQAWEQGLLASAHDSSDGGLAVALAECSIASGLGVDGTLPGDGVAPERRLFAEGGARIVVSVRAECMDAWRALLDSEAHVAVPVTTLGAVADHGRFRLSLGSQPVLDQAVQTLKERFDQALPRRLGTA